MVISDLWQFWNDFVRESLLLSCAGSVTRSGIIIAPRASDNSWQRVTYEALQFSQASKQHKPPPRLKAKKVSTGRFHDPTWGDLDAIVDVVNGLAPNNAALLGTAFGATSIGLKHLQVVRNACFHKHEDTRAQVRNLEAYYFTSSRTRDVADLAWVSYLGKTTPAIYDWIDAFAVVSAEVTK